MNTLSSSSFQLCTSIYTTMMQSHGYSSNEKNPSPSLTPKEQICSYSLVVSSQEHNGIEKNLLPAPIQQTRTNAYTVVKLCFGYDSNE